MSAVMEQPDELQSHPAAELWPMLKADDLSSLTDSIRERGLRQPITLCDGMILDGRNRYRACLDAGVDPVFVEFDGGDPYLFVFDQNGERRLDVTNAMKYGIWTKTAERSEAWQAEQERIAASAAKRRADALAARDRNEDGTVTAGNADIGDAYARGETPIATLADIAASQAAFDAESADKRSARYASSCTSSTTTGQVPKAEAERAPTRAAKAAQSKTDAGTVAKMDALKASDPDLFEQVATGDMPLARAQKQAQRRRLDERRTAVAAEAASMAITDDRIDLRHADCESLLDAEPMALDWIVTDPPYPGEFLPCFDLLAKIAARHLREGGSLLCMSGQMYLPQVYAALSAELSYHWTLGYMTPGGQATQIHPRKVNTFWKPILWYTRGTFAGEWIGDVTKSDVNDNDKTKHHWGQSESGMSDLMRRFIRPGDTVLDPFMGAGTTGIVALDLGASFIGIERDQAHFDQAKVRHASV